MKKLFLGILVSGLVSSHAFAASVDDPRCAQWQKIIEGYKSIGTVVKNSADWKEVQINAGDWRRMDYDAKTNFTDNTAKCLADGSITIRDNMTGKVLASRGLFAGTKITE